MKLQKLIAIELPKSAMCMMVCLLLITPLKAQSLPDVEKLTGEEPKVEITDSTEEAAVQPQTLNPLQKGTGIWSGSLFFQRKKNYVGQREMVNNRLNFNLQYIKMYRSSIGVGVRGFSQVFMAGNFGGVELGSAAFGPVVRVYPWQNSRVQTFIQGQFLTGYNLALADAMGANENTGLRYRPGIRAGLGYRLSNPVGVFLEIGPDWEGGAGNGLDSRGLQFNVGIQLFRF